MAVLSCQSDLVNRDVYGTTQLPEITTAEQDALLFMLEEEKLAKDVYAYLGAYWSHNTFLNIERSESTHVNAVISLLNAYELEFYLAEAGTFHDDALQELYYSLIALGESDLEAALTVGATIEDLDIADLETYLNAISNPLIENTFSNLQCGSRNHLRAFTNALETLGGNYTPQYIRLEEYTEIINSTQERCN
jgi:hypothetical protein